MRKYKKTMVKVVLKVEAKSKLYTCIAKWSGVTYDKVYLPCGILAQR